MKMQIHECLTKEAETEVSKLLLEIADQSTEGVFVVDPTGIVLGRYCGETIANSPLISTSVEIFNRTSLAMPMAAHRDVQQIILVFETGRITIASCGSAASHPGKPGPAMLIRIDRIDTPEPIG